MAFCAALAGGLGGDGLAEIGEGHGSGWPSLNDSVERLDVVGLVPGQTSAHPILSSSDSIRNAAS